MNMARSTAPMRAASTCPTARAPAAWSRSAGRTATTSPITASRAAPRSTGTSTRTRSLTSPSRRASGRAASTARSAPSRTWPRATDHRAVRDAQRLCAGYAQQLRDRRQDRRCSTKRLQINLSAYDMDWNNVQFAFYAPQQLGNTTFLTNGPNYNIKGVELQLTGHVTPGSPSSARPPTTTTSRPARPACRPSHRRPPASASPRSTGSPSPTRSA